MTDISTGAQMAKNINRVLRAGVSGVPRDLDKLGINLVDQLRVELSQPGKGRIYDTLFFTDGLGRVHPYGSRPPHRASAPGDPPAVDTGQLRASWGHDTHREPNGAVLVLATGDPKASLLEFGTSKILPRPSLRPVINRNHPTIRRLISEGFEGRERAMARRLGGRG